MIDETFLSEKDWDVVKVDLASKVIEINQKGYVRYKHTPPVVTRKVEDQAKINQAARAWAEKFQPEFDKVCAVHPLRKKAELIFMAERRMRRKLRRKLDGR